MKDIKDDIVGLMDMDNVQDMQASKEEVQGWADWFRKIAVFLENIGLKGFSKRFYFAAGACYFINGCAAVIDKPATDASHKPTVNADLLTAEEHPWPMATLPLSPKPNLPVKVRNVSGNSRKPRKRTKPTRAK